MKNAVRNNAINANNNDRKGENAMTRNVTNTAVYDHLNSENADNGYTLKISADYTDNYTHLTDRETAEYNYIHNADTPIDNAVLDDNSLYSMTEITDDSPKQPDEKRIRLYNALFDRNIMTEITYIANKYQLLPSVIGIVFDHIFDNTEITEIDGMSDDDRVNLLTDCASLVTAISVYDENCKAVVRAYRDGDNDRYGMLLNRLSTRLTVSRLKKISSVGNDISNLVYSANDTLNGERIFHAIQAVTKTVYDDDGKAVGIKYQYENGDSASRENEALMKQYRDLFHDGGADLTQTCALAIHTAIVYADTHNILTDDFLSTEILCLDRRSLTRKDGKRNYTLKTPIQSAVSKISRTLYGQKKAYTTRNIDTEIIAVHDTVTDTDITHTTYHAISALSDNYTDDDRIKRLLKAVLKNRTEYAVFYSHYQKLMSITDIAMKLNTTKEAVKDILKSAKRHLATSAVISNMTERVDYWKRDDTPVNGAISKAVRLYTVTIQGDKIHVTTDDFKSISETALYIDKSRQAVIKAMKRHEALDMGQLNTVTTAEPLMDTAIDGKYFVRKI